MTKLMTTTVALAACLLAPAAHASNTLYEDQKYSVSVNDDMRANKSWSCSLANRSGDLHFFISLGSTEQVAIALFGRVATPGPARLTIAGLTVRGEITTNGVDGPVFVQLEPLDWKRWFGALPGHILTVSGQPNPSGQPNAAWTIFLATISLADSDAAFRVLTDCVLAHTENR